MRFQGICYRAHEPKWSFMPLSGSGASINGGRFNPKGIPALYLSLSVETAIKEITGATVSRGLLVEKSNSSAVSMRSAPFVRERRPHMTVDSLQNQQLTNETALMCH
jgi:RES domain-containing protein